MLDAVTPALPGPVALMDEGGTVVYGTIAGEARWNPLALEDLGSVVAPPASLGAVVALVTQWVAKENERRALASEVLHLYREVNLFEQLSSELAAVLDVGAVGEASLAQARRLIQSSSGGVFLRGAWCARFGEVDALEQLATVTVQRAAAVLGDDTLAAPLCVKGETLGAIVLRGAAYSTVELKLLNTIALQAGIALDTARAIRDREQLAALHQELDTARTIQHSLVPNRFPAFPHRREFDLHASMTSAKAVGGDFYDFFLIDEHRLGLVLGDVSGKGVPSALYMAVMRTHIKSTALQGMVPAECMRVVNEALVRDKASSMFATCFYGILDLQSGEFDFCNAGHNPPYRLTRDAVLPLELAGGPPLGLFGGLPFEGGTLNLAQGEAIFLYTDGVPEATNLAEDDFTDEALASVLTEARNRPCAELLTTVQDRVMAFTGGAPQSDDITMLAVRRLD